MNWSKIKINIASNTGSGVSSKNSIPMRGSAQIPGRRYWMDILVMYSNAIICSFENVKKKRPLLISNRLRKCTPLHTFLEYLITHLYAYILITETPHTPLTASRVADCIMGCLQTSAWCFIHREQATKLKRRGWNIQGNGDSMPINMGNCTYQTIFWYILHGSKFMLKFRNIGFKLLIFYQDICITTLTLPSKRLMLSVLGIKV